MDDSTDETDYSRTVTFMERIYEVGSVTQENSRMSEFLFYLDEHDWKRITDTDKMKQTLYEKVLIPNFDTEARAKNFFS